MDIQLLKLDETGQDTHHRYSYKVKLQQEREKNETFVQKENLPGYIVTVNAIMFVTRTLFNSRFPSSGHYGKLHEENKSNADQ